MNQPHPSSPFASGDAAEARFARNVVAVLDRGLASLEPDVSIRLRFARARALERAQLARNVAAVQRLGATAQGAAVLGSGPGWWVRVAAFAPLVALVCGLVLIQRAQDRAQVSVAAEVDAALLADVLPPRAYTDPGFGEFLKLPARP